MSDDNVMYDTPLEFVTDAIQSDECAAQSVIPLPEGGFLCGCACEKWETTASSVEEGLRLARQHTGTVWPDEATAAS